MDTLGFRVGSLEPLSDHVLDVLVNGRPLADVVGEVELPFARVEDRPNIAGGYRGLPLGLLKGRLPQHFLGSPDSHLDCGPHHKTVLLGCGCGEAGCWPLMSRVHVGEATVRWDDFEQPHRSDGWTYGPLCFEFDRRQYEAALQEIVIPA